MRRDAHHKEAAALWKGRREPLIVGNHVLGEVWTFLRRRDSHAVALRARRAIESSSVVEVVHVPADLETEAWEWLGRHGERTYSLVDATSFSVMRKRGLLEALAFDGDFSAAGFVEVRP